MANDARARFDRNCADIEHLLSVHAEIGANPSRRHQLSVLNRSGIVLMCAFWEAFCEDLAANAVAHVVRHAPDPTTLASDLKRTVAKELKADPHQLAIWDLADNGWRGVLTRRLTALQQARNWSLNTPKSSQIKSLFSDALGVPDITSSWYWKGTTVAQATTRLDQFVTLRGEIAHRGKVTGVGREHVEAWLAFLRKLVVKTDSAVNRHVKAATNGIPMWGQLGGSSWT